MRQLSEFSHDFNRKKFESTGELRPHIHHYEAITLKCVHCGMHLHNEFDENTRKLSEIMNGR